jgi:transcriptional antiterminator RfaH
MGRVSEDMAASDAAEWLVVYTKPRWEFKVRDALLAHEMNIFLPVVTVRHPGKPPRVQPLFPRYLFVRLDLALGIPEPLRWTAGVSHLVSFGERPARMPDEALDLIREHVADLEGSGGPPTHDFQVGQRVHIRSGPLQGLYAIFQGPLKPSERVTLLVDFLSRANRVQVPVEEVEALSPNRTARPPRRTRGHGRKIRQAPNP